MTAPQLTAQIQGQGTVSADQLNTYIQNCENIAMLRSFIGLPGMCVFIDGSVTPGDGGAGSFYWNTTATGPDNDSTVIVPQPGVPGAWIKLPISGQSPLNISNISALRGFIGGTGSPVVWVEGYYTIADGGEGMFVYNPSDTTSADNGGTIIIDAMNHRYYRESIQNNLNVKWFGAYGNGTNDDTKSIQSAVSTGMNVYIPSSTGGYLVTNSITSTVTGQVIEGDDRETSYLLITNSFNLFASGVVISNTGMGVNGIVIKKLGFKFTQPDTSTIGSIIQYPPALYAQSQPRFEIRECQISNAWVGIDMRGNSGGAYIIDLQLSMYSYGIMIDGSEDTVRIDKLHCWPFNMTANQETIFFTGSVIGVNCGRCDGLFLTDCLFINNTQLNLYQGSTGNTFGSAENCGFDSNIGLIISAGQFSVTGGYFSLSSGNKPSIYMTGASSLNVNGVTFNQGNTSTFPVIDINPTTTPSGAINGSITISGCTFFTAQANVNAISLTGTPTIATEGLVSDCMFIRTPNIAYTTPLVSVVGNYAVLSMSNCRVAQAGSGSGTFINIAVDNYHRVIGNSSPGYTNSFPAAVNAIYQYN